MCFHRRLLFTCNHHTWLDTITKPCEVEEAFARGERDTGCGVRWSHGFDTVRVQEKCVACARTRADEVYRFGVVKEQIRVLWEAVGVIKGVVEGEGEKEREGEEKKGGETSSEKEENPSSSSSESSEFLIEADVSSSSADAASSSPSSTANSFSSAGGSEDTGVTSWEEGGDVDETMEEMRVDPKHRPLKLPQIVAEGGAKRVDDEVAVQGPVHEPVHEPVPSV